MTLFLLALFLVQDEPVELRWSFAKGDVHRYRMTQRVSTDANGVPVRQLMTTTMALEVLEVDGRGSASIRALYEAVAARASGVQEYDYDSEKDKEPPDDPMARLMSKLVGQSFTMTMGPDGKVLDVRGYDKLVDAMVSGLAGENEASKEKARQALGQSFSDEAFRSRMQQLAPALPAGKVKKGDTWTSDFTVRLPVVDRVTYRIRSRLAELKDGQARIEQDVAVEFKAAEEREPGAAPVEAREAKGKSTCVFSLSPGRFVSQKAEIEITLVMGKTAVPVHVETELSLLPRK